MQIVANRSLPEHGHTRPSAFAISEIILVITTATLVVSTAFTALSVFLSVTDEQVAITLSGGRKASVLPADELNMDAVLFHLEFQEVTHAADLTYVIGGKRSTPGSESAAQFSYDPPLDSNQLRVLNELDSMVHVPSRALSSRVITDTLAAISPSDFSEVEVANAPYAEREFTVLTVLNNRTVTSVTTHRVTPNDSWVVFESVLYRPSGNSWSESTSYRCAVAKSDYVKHRPLLALGASHFWIRHDRASPVGGGSNSLWDRYEEGYCRVEFPDNHWNLALHLEGDSLVSKYTYFLPVAK